MIIVDAPMAKRYASPNCFLIVSVGMLLMYQHYYVKMYDVFMNNYNYVELE